MQMHSNIRIRKSEHSKSLLFQKDIANSIFLNRAGFAVLVPVEFNNKTRAEVAEIYNVGSKANLPPEVCETRR